MTLQLAFLIISLSATAALAAWKWHSFACADLERLHQHEHWSGRFTRGVRILMDDDRVPRPFMEMLLGLNGSLLDRNACVILYRIFITPERSSRLVSLNSDGEHFYENDRELALTVSETLFAAIMAISYTDIRWGERTRGAMARLYRGEAQVTELASVAAREVNRRKHERDDHSFPHGLIPA